MPQSSISLNKYISQTGICSRREADRWIDSGRVKINGEVARKGNRVLPEDKVTLDDTLVGAKPSLIYLALNKPPGVTSTTDLADPDNIIDFVGHPQRIFPIGRLDKASSGLILLTNDGDIVNMILREENNHEKEYLVRIDKPITPRFMDKMSRGVPILGTVTKPCVVQRMGKSLFKITLTQGLNRQIRRMCTYLGCKVMTLKRIRIMNIHLDRLEVGHWRELKPEELKALWGKLGK